MDVEQVAPDCLSRREQLPSGLEGAVMRRHEAGEIESHIQAAGGVRH